VNIFRDKGRLHLKRGAKLTLRVAEIAFAFVGWIAAAIGWLLWTGWVATRLAWRAGRLMTRSVLWMMRRRSRSFDLQFAPDRSISPPNS
jgi:hypothetical protein